MFPVGLGCFELAYQLNDHLGNVRAVIMKNGENAVSLTAKTDYYPFGMPMPNRNIEGNYRYGYQGEFAEKDKETGLNAFQLRMYDARIGRWISPDPYGEFHSPYLAMANNPASVTDPDGGCTTKGGSPCVFSVLGGTATDAGGNIWSGVGDTATELHTPFQLNDVIVFGVGKDATVKVLTETDGIGHTYIQVGGIVFSNGRYNGSDSPSMGDYGLTGDNVLIRKTGKEAENFVSDRTEKYPTTVQTVNNVDAGKVFKDLNTRYNNGSPNPNGAGVIDGRYNLLTRNCTTASSVALKAGGLDVHAVAPGALPLQINLSNQGIDPKAYFQNAGFEALRGPKF